MSQFTGNDRGMISESAFRSSSYYSATEQSLTGLIVIWEKVLEAKTYRHLGLDEAVFFAHYDHVQQRVAAHSGIYDEGAEVSKTILKCGPELEEYVKIQSTTFFKAIHFHCHTFHRPRSLNPLYSCICCQ
jgi:hypothetical protein